MLERGMPVPFRTANVLDAIKRSLSLIGSPRRIQLKEQCIVVYNDAMLVAHRAKTIRHKAALAARLGALVSNLGTRQVPPKTHTARNERRPHLNDSDSHSALVSVAAIHPSIW